MELHDFDKQNLVTTNKGDLYKCSICGATGYRRSLAEVITVSETEFKKALKCTKTKNNTSLSFSKVTTKDMPYIGLEEGIHKIVECPVEYKDKFNNDVWVFSKKRNEPVRLLPHEYTIIK